jgi:hypothetical protein
MFIRLLCYTYVTPPQSPCTEQHYTTSANTTRPSLPEHHVTSLHLRPMPTGLLSLPTILSPPFSMYAHSSNTLFIPSKQQDHGLKNSSKKLRS